MTLSARRLVAGSTAATTTGGDADGEVALTSPAVGVWRTHAAAGALVRGGDVIGTLEVLGASIEIVAPPGAHGLVDERRAALAWRAVGHGEVLLALDPRATAAASGAGAEASHAAAAASGLVFAAPLSGRFFARSAPGKPPFVAVGAVLEPGATVCMLEVMKTFNRVTYGGPGLPERARVVAVLVADEEDVTMGQAILQLEAV